MRYAIRSVIILLFATHGFAIPQLINYQGSLTAPDGTPMDTTVAMVFRIYEISYGGNMLWMETHPTVEVNGGLFHVLLGSVTPLTDLFSADRWLEVQVGSDFEMTPRQQIVSVAHAYRVGTVDGASGGTVSGDVTVTGKATIGPGNSNSGVNAFVAGESNIATGTHATIGGGNYNRARGNYSVVAGGGGDTEADSNSVSGTGASISGGARNQATADFTTVGGGWGNTASGANDATVGGGSMNVASGAASTVAGGYHNTASGANDATVGGGAENVASGSRSTVAGGRMNTAAGAWAAVGGGQNNSARGDYSVIAGGGGPSWSDSNSATGYVSFIGGGSYNQTFGNYSAVAGGANNVAAGSFSAVPGGMGNTAGEHAFAAGDSNEATGFASCAAGSENHATGNYSIALGRQNQASGGMSVAIGYNNSATGWYSFAAGKGAGATDGGFTWADGSPSAFQMSVPNRFGVRASGGVYFYTNSSASSGVFLNPGGSSWGSISDSTRKRNIRLSDARSVLDKVAALPVKDWEYKSEKEGTQHIGPMAQDFWNAFHLGTDSLAIETIDADGVALAAIQELAKQNSKLETRNLKLEEELAALGAQVQSLLARDERTQLKIGE